MGATGMVKATQTIYHDPDYPSALLLPIVPTPSEEETPKKYFGAR